MATILADDFNRADSTTLGGNWVESQDNFQIVSNKVKAVGSPSFGYLTNTTAPGSTDYQVSCVVNKSLNTGSDGVIARWTDVDNQYLLRYNGTGSLDLYKRVASSFSLLGSVTPTGSFPHTIKLSVQGTAIKAYEDGVQVISVTDSALSAAGRFGLHTSTIESDGATLDDFLAEDFAAAAQDTPELRGHRNQMRQILAQ